MHEGERWTVSNYCPAAYSEYLQAAVELHQHPEELAGKANLTQRFANFNTPTDFMSSLRFNGVSVGMRKGHYCIPVAKWTLASLSFASTSRISVTLTSTRAG